MRAAAATLALLLIACSHKAQTGSNAGNASQDQSTAGASADANASADDAAALPPSGSPARFIGTWATSKANCAHLPWRFTKDSLSATGGPHCSIYKVMQSPGGFDLAAECPAKKPIPTDLIKLRFAESAGAMLLESNAIPPTGLIYCGK